MNILHIGICVYGRPEGLEKAFMSVAKNYYAVRPENVTEGLKLLQWRPDIVFLQVQGDNYPEALKSVLRHYKNQGSKVINWSGDVVHRTPQYAYDLAPYVTKTCFSNDRDVENMRKAGYESEFLQIGIDPDIFNPDGPKDPNAGKIVFLANHRPDYPNAHLRMELVRELKKEYGQDFKVYGNGWGEYGDGEVNVKNPLQDVFTWQSTEAAIYRGCEIAISMSQFQESRYTSDRLFRAMGCGAFTLVHEFPGWQDVIPWVAPEREAYNVFRDINELKLMINYYLGYLESMSTEIHENYTYDHMVQNIIRL